MLKETKTTIPISRTPKPISEFGLKPGKYRPSAVKVAGFDPLDANHVASTGGVLTVVYILLFPLFQYVIIESCVLRNGLSVRG